MAHLFSTQLPFQGRTINVLIAIREMEGDNLVQVRFQERAMAPAEVLTFTDQQEYKRMVADTPSPLRDLLRQLEPLLEKAWGGRKTSC